MLQTRVTKDGTPDGRFAQRTEHLARLVELLRGGSKSVAELAKALRVTKRAVYFLFRDLEKRGTSLARIGDRANGRYLLLPPT